LLFDDRDELCGRQAGSGGAPELERPAKTFRALAFCGVHILSPRIFDAVTERGVFSIIPAYLRLASVGESILGVQVDDCYWRDLGRAEQIEQAALDIKSGTYPLLHER
jgi:NDP-sugar pyrophosphorylase family protein